MTWAPYVGLPFGEGPGEVTCWSLVRRVYADRLGIALPAYGDTSAQDLVAVARQITRGAEGAVWTVPDAPHALDVVLMRSGRGGRAICHVGVMTGPATLLHVEAATHSVMVPLRHFSVAGRIAGFRRYAG